MKKILLVSMSALLVFSMFGCKNNKITDSENSTEQSEIVEANWDAIVKCNINGDNVAFIKNCTVGNIGTDEKNHNDKNIFFVWHEENGIKKDII